MPGWYAHLREPLAAGRLQSVGIIQEQHPDRTRLFNQWQRLPMDLLLDPLNRLEVSAVPIVLLVDEQGVIRSRNPRPEQLEEFLAASFTRPEADPTLRNEATTLTPLEQADEQVLRGELDEGIGQYERMLAQQPDNARLHFRLGVARRMRYDSPAGRDQDFTQAVAHWRRALSLDPNQYIWRRRLQQYGPVLDKPYPFYRWVAQARAEILARGEQPVELRVEPSGAELAEPSRFDARGGETLAPPDPSNRLLRDTQRAVQITSVVIPATDPRQTTARVHLLFSLDLLQEFQWNNEAEPIQIWCERGVGVELGSLRVTEPPADAATSDERRMAEVEVAWSAQTDAPVKLEGYVVYNLCHKPTGECQIRRQDFSIEWKPR